MLQSLNNMDKVFRQSRILTIICVVGMVAVSLFSVFYVHKAQTDQSRVVYALIGNNAVSLGAIDVLDNRPVEARNHVDLFHGRLFGLDPDREVIDRNLDAAMAMGDASVKRLIETYEEKNYYRGLINGNVSQSVSTDSVYVDMSVKPYYFRFTGELTITRTSSIATRSLISEGYFRDVQRSQLNPHGFLIEKYRILENEDKKIVAR